MSAVLDSPVYGRKTDIVPLHTRETRIIASPNRMRRKGSYGCQGSWGWWSIICITPITHLDCVWNDWAHYWNKTRSSAKQYSRRNLWNKPNGGCDLSTWQPSTKQSYSEDWAKEQRVTARTGLTFSVQWQATLEAESPHTPGPGRRASACRSGLCLK